MKWILVLAILVVIAVVLRSVSRRRATAGVDPSPAVEPDGRPPVVDPAGFAGSGLGEEHPGAAEQSADELSPGPEAEHRVSGGAGATRPAAPTGGPERPEAETGWHPERATRGERPDRPGTDDPAGG